MSQAGLNNVSSTPSVATTFNEDTGSATPVANILNIFGGNAIATSGSGNTVTIALVAPVTVPNGGTGDMTLTQHGFLIGNGVSAVNVTAAPANGQIPIGSAGADPVIANITAGSNITITNGPGSITINANVGPMSITYTPVVFVQSPYTVLATDDYLGVNVTGGAITIKLPNAPATGRVFVVKDTVGGSAASNITITTVGGVVTIDGATTYVIAVNRGAASLIFNGTSYEVY